MVATRRRLIPEEGRELIGSPYPAIVGDVFQYSVNLGGTVEVDANCWMHAWKGSSSATNSVLSGSMSASENILTLMTISNEIAAEYRYTFKVKKDGNYIVYFFRRKVERESGVR